MGVKIFLLSVKTGNCESAKGAFTLVTLQSAKNVKTTGLKGPLVKKALTGFTARITGLPVLDGETNFKASCKNFKNKNCLFPCKCYRPRLDALVGNRMFTRNLWSVKFQPWHRSRNRYRSHAIQILSIVC